MLLLKRGKLQAGYQEIVGEGNGYLRYLRFGLLRMEPGDVYQGQWPGYESVLVLIQGAAEVQVGDAVFQDLRRTDVFREKATAVYVPVGSSFILRNVGNGELEVAVCKALAKTSFAPFVVRPEQVHARIVGKDNWRREVHDIVVKQGEGRVERILVGETLNDPGNWSSYPPHKHDTYLPGVEACMEELYHYRLQPEQGFGLQYIYTDDRSLDEIYAVRQRDTFLIPRGYHPVCAAPGYRLYYLWVMAGDYGRDMMPHDDPDHAWVKQLQG